MKRKTKTGVKLLTQVIERMAKGKKEVAPLPKSNGPSEASSQEDGSKSNFVANENG